MEGRISASYLKIRDWLLAYINERGLQFGDRIPSERYLADELGLSRPKVARAITELVDEGILIRENRSGTFVGEHSPSQLKTPTRTISVVSAGVISVNEPAQRHTLFEDIVRGVASVASEQGYNLVVRYNQFPEEESQVLEGLSDEGVDGAVIFPGFFPDSVRHYAKYGTSWPPIVIVDHCFPELPLDYVVTDNFSGARDAVRHLISRGHRRIAFFTDFLDVSSIRDRDAGYRAALEEAGIPYDENIVCGPQVMRHTRYNYDFTLDHLMRLDDPVTAVFGMNDNMLWAALQAAQHLGLLIPQDLELAGFFDSPIPAGIKTSFTRVSQANFDIGREAARILLMRISGEGPEKPQQIQIPPTLIE